jgi:hypothetical protein
LDETCFFIKNLICVKSLFCIKTLVLYQKLVLCQNTCFVLKHLFCIKNLFCVKSLFLCQNTCFVSKAFFVSKACFVLVANCTTCTNCDDESYGPYSPELMRGPWLPWAPRVFYLPALSWIVVSPRAAKPCYANERENSWLTYPLLRLFKPCCQILFNFYDGKSSINCIDLYRSVMLCNPTSLTFSPLLVGGVRWAVWITSVTWGSVVMWLGRDGYFKLWRTS